MYVSRRTSSTAASMADSTAAKYPAPLLRSVMRFPRTGIKGKLRRQASGERDMVRELGPRAADVALHSVELEVAHVDAIEREDREPRGIAASVPSFRALEYFVEAELLGKRAAR